jgi:hypothetical protein
VLWFWSLYVVPFERQRHHSSRCSFWSICSRSSSSVSTSFCAKACSSRSSKLKLANLTVVFFNALLASLNARSNILANTLEAGVSMTVLSTRHRGEESRKEYDGFYHMQTPTNSVPDLRSLNGDVRRHSRRPSVRSHRRGSSRQDGMAEVPCTPRSAPPSIRSHRPSASTHGRPGDASLIPELPKSTHRIHLDGRGSEVVSPNPPPHGSIDTTSSPVSSAPSTAYRRSDFVNQFPIQPEFSTSEETDLPYLSLPTSPVRYPSFLPY